MDGILSIDVDINSFVPYQFKTDFEPIEVDLSYGGGVKIDEELSKNKRVENFNEWSDVNNISILSRNQLSQKNHNCGIPSSIKEPLLERIGNFLFRD